jgi:hypothetical protein
MFIVSKITNYIIPALYNMIQLKNNNNLSLDMAIIIEADNFFLTKWFENV